ncbi:MFS transporter [Streptomyces sp. NPDC102283]|uniref:MFS transporter n=1 Tax=Streptomyces sp. NPDC102283 TaxID=3366155 RepID=UPI00380F8D27
MLRSGIECIVYKRLLPLALATFAVGTDGFVIAGLLPAIAQDLEVSVPAAGQLVTAFALTLAVAAPVLGWATSSMDRRKALILALILFAIGNAATALGTTYAAVLTARVITAAGAGIITSSASSAAAVISPPERRGRALAFVLGGLTLSSAIGLPLGTLIGSSDWHITLWAVAALGLVAALGVAAALPRTMLPATTFRARVEPLGERRVLGTLAVTMLTLTGAYLLYTYVGAALDDTTGGSGTTLTRVLFVFGLGVLGGNLLAGRLCDRYPAERLLTGGLAAFTVVLLLARPAIEHLATTFVWAAVWGLLVGVPTVLQQHRLVAHAPAATPVLLGLNSSAIYLGIALGGALGGLLQKWLSPVWLGVPAAGITLMALVWTLVSARSGKRVTAADDPEPATSTGRPQTPDRSNA